MDRSAGALPRHAQLPLIGDMDQLPSVGPGSVLADIIRSQVVPGSSDSVDGNLPPGLLRLLILLKFWTPVPSQLQEA